MDINESLQPVVAGIINNLKASIESELRAQISNEVINKIATTEFDNIVTNLVEQQTRSRLEQYNFIGKSDEQLQKIVKQITDDINRTLATEANTKINNYLNQKLAQIDVNAVIGTIVENKLTNLLQTQKFPEQSIPHTSIDFSGLKITGDAINGGIIANFGSTGIEDRATFVQLTLMDHASAFEGPLYAPELNVKGNVTVDGTLVINGDLDPNTPAFVRLIDRASDAVKLKLDGDFFTDYSDIIFNRIRTDGIDLDTITQGGKDIVKGNQLGYHITDTNIRRLGLVNDLQTLVDGSIQSDVVTIGTVQMSSASSIPNYPGIAGQIVWNSAPGHGSAVGWVCLGATLWAKIGTID